MRAVLVRRHRQPQRFGNWPSAATGHKAGAPAHAPRDRHGFARAHYPLMQRDRGAFDFLRPGDDFQHVVHARRLEELDGHGAHHEGEARRLLLGLLEQRALIGAEQAQIVGAAALHEAQIARVIDDAGKIGVLVIDPHRHKMASGADLSVERVHRQLLIYLHPVSSPWHVLLRCIAASQLRPSKRLGVIASASKPSRQRALTSILSGSERGT